MRLARFCTDLVFAALEARIGAAQALTSEAYALAREQHIGVDDVDREVLLDRLILANRHLTSLLCAIDPDLEEYGVDGAVAAAASTAARYRPRIAPRGDARGYLIDVIRIAVDRNVRAGRLLKRFEDSPESRVVRSIRTAAGHLKVALLVLAPARAADEGLELSLAEHRQIVRERRGLGGGEMTSV